MAREILNTIKKWWQTDTAKAIATVVAVLLIPGAVIAWNYASNKELDINATDDQISESIDAESTNSEAKGEVAGDETSATNEEQGSSHVGGINEITKLPNTSAEQDYVVKAGDNIYKISMEICGDESFYVNNMRNNYLKVGETIKVVCE